MRIRRKKTAKTVVVLLLCLVLAATLVVCGLTCAKHVLHSCAGGDCRICDLLLNTSRALKQLALSLLPLGIAAVASGLLLLYFCHFCVCNQNGGVLARLRIRLNN